MQPLPIDQRVVDECRQLAAQIAEGVHRFIDAHTTSAIERTVLRAYGVDGADNEGVPLVNICVERYLKSGRGIATPFWDARWHAASKSRSRRRTGSPGAPTSTTAPAALRVKKSSRCWLRTPAPPSAAHRRAPGRSARRPARAWAPGPTPLEVRHRRHRQHLRRRRSGAGRRRRPGADIIAVIRSTAQSLIDYVPYGATTEGFGGTWATQENFKIVRRALDEEQEKLGRYLQQVNYSSGLCMPEIAYLAAVERLDMLLNDAMYGILFRDINPKRTLCDQYFSRRIIARAGIIINTGEDNYLTTADAVEKAHTVLSSQFINEALAKQAGLPDEQMGLGHAFEIDKSIEDSFLMELAQAQLVRQIFPRHPIKWMPATKHKSGDIFWSHRVDGLFDLVGVATNQSIELLGMMTESVHTPLLQDRFVAIKGADYVFNAARHLSEELFWNPDGRIVARARLVLDEAHALLEEVAKEGMFSAVARGAFADVKRPETGGRGLSGVVEKAGDYLNPIRDVLEGHAHV